MKALGLDIGDKKIGVAIGDTDMKIASPREIISVEGRDRKIETIKVIIENEGIGIVIAGMPYNLKGEISHQAKKVETFLKHLRKAINVPVETIDERMSSKMSHTPDDDAVAASLILQTWFERQRNREVTQD